MFHEGSLQSGIARAIQEQKLVACFVRDGGEESRVWEEEWLQNGWLEALLVQKAVLLRIEAGSTEAGFLSAFCPLEKVPAFVVIENGQLQDQLVSGITKDDFINRIRKVLGANPIPVASAPSQNAVSQRSSETSTPAPAPAPRARLPTPSPPLASPPYMPVSPILPPSSKAKGKQKATPPDAQPSNPSASSQSTAQQTARDALRRKKQEEKEELARIQARIDAAKAARKAQAEQRKAERDLLSSASPSTTSPSPSTSAPTASAFTAPSTRGAHAATVNLSIRLFDGRTIRRAFPRSATLQTDVRPWIDAAAKERADHPGQTFPPYVFRQILAPLPSRELAAGEEAHALGDIDLAPSATLVLVPVKGYTDAYASSGAGVVGGVVGGVTGLVGGVFGAVRSVVGYVGGALGSVVGLGGSSTAVEGGRSTGDAQSREQVQQERAEAAREGIRVRTLADQRGETAAESQELYNGNQLNFEPRDEEADKRE